MSGLVCRSRGEAARLTEDTHVVKLVEHLRLPLLSEWVLGGEKREAMDEGAKRSAELVIPTMDNKPSVRFRHLRSRDPFRRVRQKLGLYDLIGDPLVIVLSILDVVLSHHLDLAQRCILLPLQVVSAFARWMLAHSESGLYLLTLRKSTFLRGFCS